MMSTTYELLGVRVQPLALEDILSHIAEAIGSGKKLIIANHNLHSIYLFHRDEKMRRLFAMADVVHADGMSIVALGRILGYPFDRSYRVTYGDLLPRLAERAAAESWRLFYLGAEPGVAERGAALLRSRYPGLEIAAMHGYFDPTGPANEERLKQIAAFRPNVLLVGMGMPRQEHWIVDNVGRLDTDVVMTAGAAIEWVMGILRPCPRWVSDHGLQWLWRLVWHPRRVWRRYLVEPWSLAPLMARDLALACRLRFRRRGAAP